MSKPNKRDWEDEPEVERLIDYISEHFPDNKNLPKRLEKATKPEDLQNEVLIFVINTRKELDELARLAKQIQR